MDKSTPINPSASDLNAHFLQVLTSDQSDQLTPFINAANKWNNLVDSLKYNNRFFLDQSFSDLFSSFEYFEEYLPTGTILYRARILTVGLFQHLSFENRALQGLPEDKMQAPPRGQTGAGRANPKGISYLYLANSPETACAEVRPIRNDIISVSRFSIKNNLKIISLHKEPSAQIQQQMGLENIAFLIRYVLPSCVLIEHMMKRIIWLLNI